MNDMDILDLKPFRQEKYWQSLTQIKHFQTRPSSFNLNILDI